jgi:hypothetical protein
LGRRLFGDLADDERFAGAHRSALTLLHEHDARTTIERLVGTTK